MTVCGKNRFSVCMNPKSCYKRWEQHMNQYMEQNYAFLNKWDFLESFQGEGGGVGWGGVGGHWKTMFLLSELKNYRSFEEISLHLTELRWQAVEAYCSALIPWQTLQCHASLSGLLTTNTDSSPPAKRTSQPPCFLTTHKTPLMSPYQEQQPICRQHHQERLLTL